MKFIPSFSIYICVNDKYNMKELTNKELNFVTKCPVILNEIVIVLQTTINYVKYIQLLILLRTKHQQL